MKIIKILKNYFRQYQIYFIDLFENQIQDCETILDLGCGANSPLGMIKQRKKYTMGIDLFEKYIETSKSKNIHDDYLLLNILDIDKKISPNSFDCVLLLGVIEHLEDLEGLRLIQKIEKIAKKKIIISTPNGFIHQDLYDNNVYQIHKSGWDINILKEIGFQVYGINGFKFLKGELGNIKFKPYAFWRRVSTISNLLVKNIPQLAFELLCIKELKKL